MNQPISFEIEVRIRTTGGAREGAGTGTAVSSGGPPEIRAAIEEAAAAALRDMRADLRRQRVPA